ncbi:MAG: YibE/F family protein [Spirochaetes bacterium]|nr:YibE/F family protein [Spirochaetota bacterium]
MKKINYILEMKPIIFHRIARSGMISALCIPLLIVNAFARERATHSDHREYTRARVEKIEKKKIEDSRSVEILVHLTVLDGIRKGEKFVSVYRGEDDLPKEMFYRPGDRVFIGISKSDNVDEVEYVSIYDVDNTVGLTIILAMVTITIIAVGRLRGALSIFSIILSVVLIFYILIPMTLRGQSPLPIAVVISLFAIITTIPIILGFTRKTLAAILGASSGVILATLLSIFAGWLMHLSGIVTNEMLTVFYASGVEIDLRSLALSGIVIAALGAIIDVCISIASATEEIFRIHPGISPTEAFKSVLTVSSDILGATVNTLLFAYVGSALPVVLLIAMRLEPGMPIMLVFNYNPVLSELVKSAIGCIGMFLSMPATAFICIELHGGRKKQTNSY